MHIKGPSAAGISLVYFFQLSASASTTFETSAVSSIAPATSVLVELEAAKECKKRFVSCQDTKECCEPYKCETFMVGLAICNNEGHDADDRSEEAVPNCGQGASSKIGLACASDRFCCLGAKCIKGKCLIE